jgi:ribosomal protein L7/L12
MGAGLVSAILENLMVLLLIVFYLVLFGSVIFLFFFFLVPGAITGIFRTVIDRRLGPLWRVEAKINLLLEHVGIKFDPYKSLPQEAADAMARGEKIRAIKIFRSATGASLKEAKDFIEEVQRRSGVEAKINLLLEHAGLKFDPYKSLPQEAVDAMARGEKIRAIKIFRSATGVSLKEAKDFIEQVQRRSAVSGPG